MSYFIKNFIYLEKQNGLYAIAIATVCLFY